VVPPHFFHFMSGSGAFWCILGACYNVNIKRIKVKTESKSSFVYQLVSFVPLPRKFCHFCMAMVHFGAFWLLVLILV